MRIRSLSIAFAGVLFVSASSSAQNAKVDVTVRPVDAASVAGFTVCIGTSVNRSFYGSEVTSSSGVAENAFQNLPAGETVLVTASKSGFTGQMVIVELKPGKNNHVSMSPQPGTGGAACGGTSVAPPPPPPAPPAPVATRLETVTAVSQTGITNTPVATAPAVRVRDQNNNPLAGVAVQFVVGATGGQVLGTATQTASTGTTFVTINRAATVTTGSDGIARLASWILGYTAGQYTVTATAGGLAPGAFTATATAPRVPSAITPVLSGTYGFAAGATMTYAPPMTVKVTDQDGAALPGVTVTFAVTSGGGSMSPLTVVTASDGTAHPSTWTLGNLIGFQTASATVAGLPAAVLKVAGAYSATTIEAASELTQTSVAGGVANPRPAALVRDQFNNVMNGAGVRFAVTSGGGSITPETVYTGADGIARANSWILGPNAGANTATAGITGKPVVTFSATGEGSYTLVVFGKRTDGTALQNVQVCIGSQSDVDAYATVKSGGTYGRAVFTLAGKPVYGITAAKAGYIGKTVYIPVSGTSSAVTLILSAGTGGPTCPGMA